LARARGTLMRMTSGTAPGRETAIVIAASLGAMSPLDYFRALRRLLAETEDETCALSQRPLARGATDFVGETLLGAADLEEAMRRSARGYNLLHGGSFNRVERHGDRIVYRIDDALFPFAPGMDAPDVRATAMEGVVLFVHAMLSQAAGRDLTPFLRAVHSRRDRATPRPGLLGCWPVPVRRGAVAHMLEYAAEAGRLPVDRDAGEFNSMQVYDRIVERLAPGGGSPATDLADRVRAAIDGGAADQPRIARSVGMSVPTLRRRLAAHGADFRALRAQALNDRARRLLAGGRRPGDVADALGFADARSFSRAFKAWNGVTPARYAAQMSEIVLSD
jgi:AraC-like DNA-binding protein